MKLNALKWGSGSWFSLINGVCSKRSCMLWMCS